MTELTEAWEVWKKLTANGGERTAKVLEAEANVHLAQKNINTPPYDFDEKYWAKRDENAVPTVSGPPQTDSKPEPSKRAPQSNFTLEEAKQLVGENDLSILEFCNKLAEAHIIILDHVAQITNSENKKNHARKGQSINQSMIFFHDYKNNPKKYEKYKKDG